MSNYSKNQDKDKSLKIGIDMNYKIEAKADNKDAGKALIIASCGLAVMLMFVGASLLILALNI